jgi:hypothetical protein
MEQRERPKSVREIKWRGPPITLVNCQGLPVTRLGEIEAAGLLVYVAEVPNGVCQLERIVFEAAEGDGFLVQRSGRIAAPQVPLDLPKAFERLDQVVPGVRPTRESDSLQEVAMCIEQTPAAPRARGLFHENPSPLRHCGASP